MANVSIPTNAVDLEGLGELKRRAQRDDPRALADVAVQFEALFIGMMLESARSASLGSGLFDGGETEQYLALMDRQVALELARQGGFGFGKLLERQLAPHEDGASAPEAPSSGAPRRAAFALRPDAPAGGEAAIAAPPRASAEPSTAEFPRGLPASLAALGAAEAADASAEPTPAEFVTALLPEAHAAADALGVEPRLLLAQAALETGWGRASPERDGESANNLFGIKAGASWTGAAVEHWTLEHADGAMAPQRERFRAYGNTADSFADYVGLISTARRYADALAQSSDPEAYARAVTKAGYATDPNYADKWLAIYHGQRLEQALRGIDLPP
jgi:flagellar protein FlgJ